MGRCAFESLHKWPRLKGLVLIPILFRARPADCLYVRMAANRKAPSQCAVSVTSYVSTNLIAVHVAISSSY